MHHIRLFEGIVQPSVHFQQLKEFEESKGLIWRLVLLVGFSVIIAVIGSLLGFGTEDMMKYITKSPRSNIEWAKVFMGFGHVVSGALFPFIVMFFFSAFFLPFFKEIGFRKFYVIQFFVAYILVLEKLFNLLLYILIGIDHTSSPMGLGIITQLVTDNVFLISIMGCLTAFTIWVAFIQIIALKAISSKTTLSIIGIVVASNLLFVILSSTFEILVQNIKIVI